MPPTNKTIQDKLTHQVIQIAAERAGLSADGIALDANFIEDLGFDSLDVVEFTMDVEEEFDLSLPDDVVQEITTVGQAVDEIRKLVESRT